MPLINLFNFECDKLLNGVDLFRNLLPSVSANASIHPGEEGRFVESLVVEFLRKSLPSQLEVASGFIVSSKDTGVRSSQVDIVIYDKQRYVPIMKYGDAVVIHDKALVAAISVKKNIRRDEITSEFQALSKIGSMCGMNGNPKPYLAVFALDIQELVNFEDTVTNSFNKILDAFLDREKGWASNEIVNDLIVLNKFIIKKKDWKSESEKEDKVRYIWCGGNKEHRNIYVQHLINGIGKVLNKINNTDTSVLVEFPSIKFKNFSREIPLIAKERPYDSSIRIVICPGKESRVNELWDSFNKRDRLSLERLAKFTIDNGTTNASTPWWNQLVVSPFSCLVPEKFLLNFKSDEHNENFLTEEVFLKERIKK